MGEAASIMANVAGPANLLKNALVFVERWCEDTDRRLHCQLVDDRFYSYPYVILHGRLKLYPGELEELVASFVAMLEHTVAVEARLHIATDTQGDVDLSFAYDFEAQSWS